MIHVALITEIGMVFYNTTDPVWSWKAHFEGGDGEANEQREVCSQCRSPAVRAPALQLHYRYCTIRQLLKLQVALALSHLLINHSSADPNSPTSKTSSLPGYGRNGLHRVREQATAVVYLS